MPPHESFIHDHDRRMIVRVLCVEVAALHERDIASDPALERQFFPTIPVLELGGERLELATSPAKLRRFLDDVLDESLV